MYIDGFPDPDAVYFNDKNLEYIEQLKEKIRAGGKGKRYIDCFGQWYLKARATENADVPDNAYYDGAQTDRALEKLQELTGGEK